MDDIDEALLQLAHHGLSAMSHAAIRDKDLGAAERALSKTQETTTKLMQQVGDKARADLQVPAPDWGDRE